MTMFNKLESTVSYECGISNRINARSVSWNSSGTYLALGCSDRNTRIYATSDLLSNASNSNSNSSAAAASTLREFVVIPSAVDRVRFHSTQDYLVATTGIDSMVKLWDVRSSSNTKSMGQIDLQKNGGAIDIAWSPIESKSHLLAVTERNSVVHIVDTRKLSSSSSSTPNQVYKASNSPFVKTFKLRPKIVDACIFSPSGDHLVAATSEDGYGELTVWNWEEGPSSLQENNDPNNDVTTTVTNKKNNTNNKKYVYPAHTGPIYSLCFSRDGSRLATGGGDALVGLWDVNSMVCSSTITRCSRFIRSVSFSYDSHIVATSTEENNIDIAISNTGEFVGKVSMTDNSRNNNNSRGGGGSSGGDRNAPGADEIAFHPNAHLLACARCDSAIYSPLAVMKLKLGR
jgi:THO complex subunit 3